MSDLYYPLPICLHSDCILSLNQRWWWSINISSASAKHDEWSIISITHITDQLDWTKAGWWATINISLLLKKKNDEWSVICYQCMAIMFYNWTKADERSINTSLLWKKNEYQYQCPVSLIEPGLMCDPKIYHSYYQWWVISNNQYQCLLVTPIKPRLMSDP